MLASDRGTPPRKKSHILQVTILDVNDNPPVIESPFGYNVSVNEVRALQHLYVQTDLWGDSGHEPAANHLLKCLCGPLVSQILGTGTVAYSQLES